jgi:hypothetical protein
MTPTGTPPQEEIAADVLLTVLESFAGKLRDYRG